MVIRKTDQSRKLKSGTVHRQFYYLKEKKEIKKKPKKKTIIKIPKDIQRRRQQMDFSYALLF